MTFHAAILLRLSANGITKRKLTDAHREAARRGRRWLGGTLNETIRERSRLYDADGDTNAWADVMTALWQVTGVAMTVDEYVSLTEAIGGLSDKRYDASEG